MENQEDKDENRQSLETIFQKKRDEWGKTIYRLIGEVRTVETIPSLQVDMLKYRHDATEEIAKLSIKNQNIESKIVLQKKELFIKYTTKTNLKLDHFSEKNTMIQADMNELLKTKEIIQIQINFIKELRDTIDKIGFAIKNRLTLFTEENI